MQGWNPRVRASYRSIGSSFFTAARRVIPSSLLGLIRPEAAEWWICLKNRHSVRYFDDFCDFSSEFLPSGRFQT